MNVRYICDTCGKEFRGDCPRGYKPSSSMSHASIQRQCLYGRDEEGEQCPGELKLQLPKPPAPPPPIEWVFRLSSLTLVELSRAAPQNVKGRIVAITCLLHDAITCLRHDNPVRVTFDTLECEQDRQLSDATAICQELSKDLRSRGAIAAPYIIARIEWSGGGT